MKKIGLNEGRLKITRNLKKLEGVLPEKLLEKKPKNYRRKPFILLRILQLVFI